MGIIDLSTSEALAECNASATIKLPTIKAHPSGNKSRYMQIILEFSGEQARKLIHSDLPVSEEQLRECVVTLLNDQTPDLNLK